MQENHTSSHPKHQHVAVDTHLRKLPCGNDQCSNCILFSNSIVFTQSTSLWVYAYLKKNHYRDNQPCNINHKITSSPSISDSSNINLHTQKKQTCVGFDARLYNSSHMNSLHNLYYWLYDCGHLTNFQHLYLRCIFLTASFKFPLVFINYCLKSYNKLEEFSTNNNSIMKNQKLLRAGTRSSFSNSASINAFVVLGPSNSSIWLATSTFTQFKTRLNFRITCPIFDFGPQYSWKINKTQMSCSVQAL